MSRATSRNSTPDSKSDLEFVVFTGRPDVNNLAQGDRKRVRSHVTRLQHHRARIVAAAQGSTSKGGSFRPSPVLAAQRSLVPPPGIPKGVRTSTITPDVRRLTRRENESLAQCNSQEAIDPHDFIFEQDQRTKDGPMLPPCQLDAVAVPCVPLDDSNNIISASLSSFGFTVSSVLACYKSMCEVQARELHQQYERMMKPWTPTIKPRPPGEWMYSLLFEDPALLAMGLMISTRYRLLASNGSSQHKEHDQVLLMEDFLIRSINTALQDDNRAVSDPLLAAVVLFASYEVKNGDVKRYHVHMQGLLKMIRLRGGLVSIGRHDPVLERLLIWSDVNTSNILGGRGYLVDMQSNFGNDRPTSNQRNFCDPIQWDS